MRLFCFSQNELLIYCKFFGVCMHIFLIKPCWYGQLGLFPGLPVEVHTENLVQYMVQDIHAL